MNTDGITERVRLAFSAEDFNDLLYYPTFVSRLESIKRPDEAEELIRMGFSLLGESPIKDDFLIA